jgi:chromosome segregation ATPase
MAEMDEVQKAIQVLVETKSFSLEGVSAINRLRDEHRTLSDLVNTLDNRISELTATNQKLTSDNQKLTEEASKMAARERAVTLREKEMTRIEIELKCAQDIANNTIDMFKTVFANAQLKTSIMREVMSPVHYNNGNGCTNSTVQKDKVQEDRIQDLG